MLINGGKMVGESVVGSYEEEGKKTPKICLKNGPNRLSPCTGRLTIAGMVSRLCGTATVEGLQFKGLSGVENG